MTTRTVADWVSSRSFRVIQVGQCWRKPSGMWKVLGALCMLLWECFIDSVHMTSFSRQHASTPLVSSDRDGGQETFSDLHHRFLTQLLVFASFQGPALFIPFTQFLLFTTSTFDIYPIICIHIPTKQCCTT